MTNTCAPDDTSLGDLSPPAGAVAVHWGHNPIRGVCRVPGSKSLTNRALLLAGFARGSSHLMGVLQSDDARFCRDVLARLGIAAEADAQDATRVQVNGCSGMPPVASGELYVGDAGTIGRFLPGLLAAAPRGAWRVTGSPQLTRRPLAPLVLALQQLGARLKASAGGGLPLEVFGGGFNNAQVYLGGDVSSQFVSGILMAAAAGGHPCTVQLTSPLVQPAYVALTVQYLNLFGAEVSPLTGDAAGWRVGAHKPVGQTLTIEADASTACYFWALAAITGGEVTVDNVGANCTQADVQFLATLARMGCIIAQTAHATRVQGPQTLRGGFAADLSAISDQTPTLAALAALADAPIRITGVGHIRHHESDRLQAMAQALRAVGCGAEVHADGMTIMPQVRRPARINPHKDHRIAMAMALVAARTPGVVIEDAFCVAKTCPDFFSRLQALGLTVIEAGSSHA